MHFKWKYCTFLPLYITYSYIYMILACSDQTTEQYVIHPSFSLYCNVKILTG